MPTQIYSSFDAYAEANHHADMRATQFARNHTNWTVGYRNLGRLGIQWGQDGSAKGIVEGATQPGGVTVFIPTHHASAYTGNGRRFDESSFMIAEPGGQFCLTTDNWTRWVSLHIPIDALAGTNAETAAAFESMNGVIQLPRQRMERLRSVLVEFCTAVQRTPAAFESVAALQAAERKLLPEIRQGLALPYEAEPMHGRHTVPRSQIVHLAMDFVDQHDGEHIGVEQLATAVGVSERTLRTAFQQFYGAAPLQFLKVRALHQVRKQLEDADPAAVTVTAIAAQFGIWELGRLAQEYRALFGETPSATLKR